MITFFGETFQKSNPLLIFSTVRREPIPYKCTRQSTQP
jgi:hypothetical protein